VSRIEVPMPQMGESIAEGTVSKWLKKPGDAVERDEPVLEISTDKVDAEIPSPAAGTLAEILVAEGETVEVGAVVAYIESGAGAQDAQAPEASAQAVPPPDVQPEDSDARGVVAHSASGVAASLPAEATEREDRATVPPTLDGAAASRDATRAAEAAEPSEVAESSEQRLRAKSTPVVRRIAQEAGVDIGRIAGTGHLGRVTKQDILSYIDQGGTDPATRPAPVPPASSRPPQPAPPLAPSPDSLWDRFHDEVEHPVFPVREGDRVETMDKMRRLTARHMVLAKRIAPHVHSFIEIDFSAIDRLRRQNRKAWEDQGARVSYTAFVAWACARVLRDFPSINGAVSGNSVIHRGSVNLGMAVDLDPGLIVPVIHDAGNLSLTGVAKRIVDLAERARARRLAPQEIQGGTFTITNPGVLGTIVGMPVIPKGTAAILGTGAIEKRVVVAADPESGEDVLAIRKRAYFSLGYDHRLVDGADAARFLARLKALLEDFPAEA